MPDTPLIRQLLKAPRAPARVVLGIAISGAKDFWIF